MSWQVFGLRTTALMPPSASTGWFIKSRWVLVASGNPKELQHMKVGDWPTSWDEHHQELIPASLQATLVFRRPVADVIEVTLCLDRCHIHATEDHLFGSGSREALASMGLNCTKSEYSPYAFTTWRIQLLQFSRGSEPGQCRDFQVRVGAHPAACGGCCGIGVLTYLRRHRGIPASLLLGPSSSVIPGVVLCRPVAATPVVFGAVVPAGGARHRRVGG